MFLKQGASSSAHVLRMMFGILSDPLALDELVFFSNFSTPSWLHRSLKRMLRRKARLHKHAKRTGNFKEYRHFQKEYKRQFRKAEWDHINNIISGFDFLPISFGEDISLLWLLFTVVWFNHGVGDDDIVVRDPGAFPDSDFLCLFLFFYAAF
jgi:hypothetical protein